MEILSTTLPYVSGLSIVLGVVPAAITIFLLICVLIAVSDRSIYDALGFLLIAAVFGAGTYVAWVVPDQSYTTHEVRITDMSRFDTDKYEIIEQRGKIFVVKEIAKGAK